MSEREPLKIQPAVLPDYCDICSRGSADMIFAIRQHGGSFICHDCMNELTSYWEAANATQSQA